jgi:hypothetical protein
MSEFWAWIYATAIGELVRNSTWGYPIFESMHLIGIAFLLGSILLVDLRVIGLARWLSVSTLSGKFLLRVTWVGFALLTISGFCLFSSIALTCSRSASPK